MARSGGQKGYMAKMKNRSNGSIKVEVVTVATIEKRNYHIGLGDYEFPNFDEPFEENGSIYCYSLRESRAIECLKEYKDNME